jgi:hypothetical protein
VSWVQDWPLMYVAIGLTCAVIFIAFWYPRHLAYERCSAGGPLHGRATWGGRCVICGHRVAYQHQGVLVQPVPTRALPVRYWPVELHQRRQARRR